MSQPWQPIADYETDPSDLSNKELRALSDIWIERLEVLGESHSVSDFKKRLMREWAIETGLIERLYTLDRGVTELLIQHGINAALIPHGSASDPPTRIAALIGDQQDAIESLFSFVKGQRYLSTSYIKELHSLFSRNQQFTEGRDQFGKLVRVPLLVGDYKGQPNNPTRLDGSIHHYCPPEHVAAEMDRLLELHADHDNVAPEVEAAWLHHRFAQIHPFQDGNGRIARALATLVFIKANWLPLVVRDRDRKTYIDALESADSGDLQPLVSFFSNLQKAEFIRAIGIAKDVEKAARVDARIDSIKRRLAKRRDALIQEWQAVKSVAEHLRDFAQSRLEEVRDSLQAAMREHQEFTFFVDGAKNHAPKDHYYFREIVSTAKALGYYANTTHYRSWARLAAKDEDQGNILISFHCIGHEFQGVLACTGTWFLRVRDDNGGYETEGEAALSDEVFQFNYKENLEDVQERFQEWLEQVIERGLAAWELAI